MSKNVNPQIHCPACGNEQIYTPDGYREVGTFGPAPKLDAVKDDDQLLLFCKQCYTILKWDSPAATWREITELEWLDLSIEDRTTAQKIQDLMAGKTNRDPEQRRRDQHGMIMSHGLPRLVLQHTIDLLQIEMAHKKDNPPSYRDAALGGLKAMMEGFKDRSTTIEEDGRDAAIILTAVAALESDSNEKFVERVQHKIKILTDTLKRRRVPEEMTHAVLKELNTRLTEKVDELKERLK